MPNTYKRTEDNSDKLLETEMTESRKEKIEAKLKQLGLKSGNWRETVDEDFAGMDMRVFN